MLGSAHLNSIYIPKSVEKIGDSSYMQQYDMNNVVFEENSNLVTIGNSAFTQCTSLTSIDIPVKVESIGARAFKDC